MLPTFEPLLGMYEPVVLGLGALAAVGVAGILVVLGLVASGARRRARLSLVTPLRPTLREAA